MQRYLMIITLLALLALSGCRAASYFSQGNEHHERGQYEDAIADYDEAIRLRPDLPEAYFIRGVTHHTLGRKQKAISDLQTALELAQAAGNDDLAATIEETLEAVRNP